MYDVTRAGRQAVWAGLLLLLATPLAAQSHRVAAGLTGGWADYNDMTPGLAPTELSAGWSAGIQLDTWLGSGRFGLRLNGTFAQRPLEGGSQAYDIIMADLGLMTRLLPAGDVRWFAPFVSLGGGAALFQGDEAPFAGGSYGEDPVIRPIVTGSLGADLLPYRRAGLRLEVTDRVLFPSIGESPEADGVPTVHNLAVTTAIQLRLGEVRGPVVRRVAAPEVRPEPRRATSAAFAASAGSAEADARDERIRALQARIAELERAPAGAGATGPAVADTPASVPQAAEAARDQLYTVQMGEFVEAETAARWIERLQRRSLPVWLLELELQGRTLTRIRVGALTGATEAETLARALVQDYQWPVRVERVEAGEPVPAGAVSATRAFLYEE